MKDDDDYTLIDHMAGRLDERAPIEQRKSFLICSWSCSAAGYDPTVCARYGCQALRHNKGEFVADFNQTKADPRYQGGRDAATLKHVVMPLDELEKQLIEARTRIGAQVEQVQHLGNALLGTEPEPGGRGPEPEPGGRGPENSSSSPPRPGKTGSLLDEAQYLHNCISSLQYQLDRLAPLLG